MPAPSVEAATEALDGADNRVGFRSTFRSMDALVDFAAGLGTLGKLAWLVGVMAVFWIAEGYYSFVRLDYSKWRHARTNLALLAIVMGINVAFGAATLGVFIWLAESEFGLLHLVEWPSWAELLAAVVLLDLVAQYGVHYALHKVPFMWRLHIVHHSDTHVDVTSGTRHHPLDFLLRELAALLVVVVTGMPLAYYLFYRIVTVFFTYWTHANVRLPAKLERVLGWVFVTPHMHKVHHHHTLPHTDTNFGNMLSVWDRLFGTYAELDERELVYGVDVVDWRRGDDLGYQLGVPWNRDVGPGLGVLREAER